MLKKIIPTHRQKLKQKKSTESTVKSKPDESIKKGAREAQPTKSKPVEKKDDSVKK